MWISLLTAAIAQTCSPTVADLPTPPDARLDGDAVIVVQKASRTLALYRNGTQVACWSAALAAGYPEGHKQRQGDRKTPEGWYRTSDRPTSRFYHALNIHYPAERDAAVARAEGRIDADAYRRIAEAERNDAMPTGETELGGLILIHGGGASVDWTLGCVALENSDIDQLRGQLPPDLQTDILILP